VSRSEAVHRRLGASALGGVGVVLLVGLGVLTVLGLRISPKWWFPTYAGGFVAGTDVIKVPPFPPLSQLDLFNTDVQKAGMHFYLLGSDGGGRDLLGLTANAVPPSLELVAAVVLVRLAIGVAAGFAMSEGIGLVRLLSRGMGRWMSGFPYLMLAIILIEATTPAGRWTAFIVGMALIGWRDIAETVASRIEHVRTQSFALSAKALGTGPFTFFRLHVLPYLRPALAVEIPFQASSVLVLLAELGYLGVFIGGATVIPEGESGVPGYTVITQPELGQLLAGARLYIERHELGPVLVPAVAIAAAAFAFELIGLALRARGPGVSE
jgi:ABC-type dipeptide/oligopeptide/nickel transport system permease subunit